MICRSLGVAYTLLAIWALLGASCMYSMYFVCEQELPPIIGCLDGVGLGVLLMTKIHYRPDGYEPPDVSGLSAWADSMATVKDEAKQIVREEQHHRVDREASDAAE